MHVLQVAENLLPQIKHHHLASPLHEIRLQIVEQETEHDKPDIDGSDFRDPHIGIRAEKEVEWRNAWNRYQIAINFDRYEVGPKNVGYSLEKN